MHLCSDPSHVPTCTGNVINLRVHVRPSHPPSARVRRPHSTSPYHYDNCISVCLRACPALSGADPLEMGYLMGIAGGCSSALLILVCLCCYAVRSRKCCFKGSNANSTLINGTFHPITIAWMCSSIYGLFGALLCSSRFLHIECTTNEHLYI